MRSKNKVMPAFAVLEPPGYQHTGIEHADRFIFLHERFSLGAFLFGPLWIIWRRLWVVLAVYLVGVGLTGYGLRAGGIGWTTIVFVIALINLLVGLEATTLLRWTRVRHGWRECGVVIADDLDMAEQRFFDNHMPFRPAAKPVTMSAPGQLPGAEVGPSPPDIVGLFPEPGGGR
jgi:uncharacterized protein DUF2628